MLYCRGLTGYQNKAEILLVQSVMHIHLQIVTEICYLAQMLLLDPRLELARETIFKFSGTSQK